MAKKMCPFLMTKHDEAFKCNCQENSCAWWHILNIQTKRGRCSLLTLAIALHWISVKEGK